MKIHEYQAKDIMRRYGIPVQPGKVATTPAEAETIAREFGVPVVIKAQVYVGGRGKAGGIQFGRSEEHMSELQSHVNLVCRLLLEKQNQLDIETASRDNP